MKNHTNALVFDDVLEKQKFLLFEKLILMAKQGYRIGGIITEKKKFEKEAGLENIELSDKRMEDIVSSILFYTTYNLGSIDDTLEEIKSIKEALKLQNIDYKITDSNKKTLNYGIKEYRYYNKLRTSKEKLDADIEKLKLHGLYMEDNKQVIGAKSEELLEAINP